MAWVVCAYFTRGNHYEKVVKDLIASLKKFELPYDITPISRDLNWDQATHYKPTFLLNMLEKHSPHNIIYVDADAIFCRYPEYFDTLDKKGKDIAVHILDHTQFRRKNCAPEMLSGTIYLRNTPTTTKILNEWVKVCYSNIKLWDQRALERVLKNYPYDILPANYCQIHDYMSSVKDPVIKHFQASRLMRRKKVKNKRKQVRHIANDGTIKINRIHR